MDKRELDMYSVQDIIEDLLSGVPVKRIARVRKVSKNTVAYSGANLPPIPVQACHPFRSKPATLQFLPR